MKIEPKFSGTIVTNFNVGRQIGCKAENNYYIQDLWVKYSGSHPECAYSSKK